MKVIRLPPRGRRATASNFAPPWRVRSRKPGPRGSALAPSGKTVASGTRAASLSVTSLDRLVRRKRAGRAGGPLGPLAAVFYASDPQTGGAPVKIRGRNVRSKDQCSMCPAIHTKSRSWLRSSSTLEPSDPPLGVVFCFSVSFRLQSLTVKIIFE